MMLGMPCNGRKIDEGVSPSFGRAPFYLFYNTLTKEIVYIENPASNSPGGAGIKAAQFLVDAKIDVVLTPRCGDNAGEVLSAAGIKMFKTNGEDLQKNIDAYALGNLEVLTETHAGFHHHGA